jgi:hypothetical protein
MIYFLQLVVDISKLSNLLACTDPGTLKKEIGIVPLGQKQKTDVM